MGRILTTGVYLPHLFGCYRMPPVPPCLILDLGLPPGTGLLQKMPACLKCTSLKSQNSAGLPELLAPDSCVRELVAPSIGLLQLLAPCSGMPLLLAPSDMTLDGFSLLVYPYPHQLRCYRMPPVMPCLIPAFKLPLDTSRNLVFSR
jgi:hypothetical protein